MGKKFIMYCFAMLVAAKFYGQVNDAQLWENIILEKNLSPKLSARIVQEGRVTDNMSSFTYNYFDLGAGYKLTKHFHLTLAYVWAQKQNRDMSWSHRHQVYGYITYKKKLHDFTINDRQMLLWQVKDYYVSETGKNPDYYLRNKLTVRYDRYFKIAPYVAAELYMNANSAIRTGIYRLDRLRCFAGVFYRTDVRNEFELYYLYETHLYETNPATNYVLGVGYTHTF